MTRAERASSAVRWQMMVGIIALVAPTPLGLGAAVADGGEHANVVFGYGFAASVFQGVVWAALWMTLPRAGPRSSRPRAFAWGAWVALLIGIAGLAAFGNLIAAAASYLAGALAVVAYEWFAD